MATLPDGIAARAHRATEYLHSFVYFVPEADEEYQAVGLKAGRMHYFASRSAPMGAVGAGVTAATFHNFNPRLVGHFIPNAWTLADPATILQARLRVADRALHRMLGDALGAPEVAELAGLARAATEPLQPDGRPLYAGHAELDWPDEPHLQLWHAASLLREYRGDGHVAALQLAGLSGLEAIVTHTATGRGFTPEAARLLRGWTEQEWTACADELRGHGLLDDAGALTEAGSALRQRIEADTDAMDEAAWLHLGEQRTARLAELGKAMTRQIVASGVFSGGMFAG
jgi:hypothetical protein